MNKDGINKSYKFLILVLLIVVLTIFLIINIFDVNKLKVNIKYAKEKTTVVASDNKNSLAFISTLYFNGKEELVNFKTYNTYLGYKIDYMCDYFNVAMESNKVLTIVSKNDNLSYLKIELITEKEYNSPRDDVYMIEDEDSTKSFSYFEGKNIYVKITKSLGKDNKSDINLRLEYMINTLYFN